MKYETEGCSFTIPDTLTVRQQLRYSGTVILYDVHDNLIRLWDGAKMLIEDWECEVIPDYEALDIEKETDPEIARIVAQVGLFAWGHMESLKGIEKK